jgi:hypothetical protein
MVWTGDAILDRHATIYNIPEESRQHHHADEEIEIAVPFLCLTVSSISLRVKASLKQP